MVCVCLLVGVWDRERERERERERARERERELEQVSCIFLGHDVLVTTSTGANKRIHIQYPAGPHTNIQTL